MENFAPIFAKWESICPGLTKNFCYLRANGPAKERDLILDFGICA